MLFDFSYSQISFFKRMDSRVFQRYLQNLRWCDGWPHIFTGNPGLSLDPRAKKCTDHKT